MQKLMRTVGMLFREREPVRAPMRLDDAELLRALAVDKHVLVLRRREGSALSVRLIDGHSGITLKSFGSNADAVAWLSGYEAPE
jgi:hypothetical protein